MLCDAKVKRKQRPPQLWNTFFGPQHVVKHTFNTCGAQRQILTKTTQDKTEIKTAIWDERQLRDPRQLSQKLPILQQKQIT